jgi:hypothetical protein
MEEGFKKLEFIALGWDCTMGIARYSFIVPSIVRQFFSGLSFSVS